MTSNIAFTIVVGFDGSEHSQTALNWAMDEARQRDGQLRLITAWNKAPIAWYPAVLETAAGEIAAEESPEQIAGTLQAEALMSLAPAGTADFPVCTWARSRTRSSTTHRVPSWSSGLRPPEASTAGKLLQRRGRAAVELPGDDDVGRGVGKDGQHNDQRHEMEELIGAFHA
jgi:hypothetical protein